jgi:hypothetical protein
MTTRITKTSFLAGEISPRARSAVESVKYQEGLAKCENYMVDVVEGIKNRPGTEYLTGTYVQNEQPRLLPFQFNEEQGYILELGDSNMRVIKDGALVLRDLVDSAYKWTLSGSGTAEYYLELAAGGDPSLIHPQKLLENDIYISEGTAGSLSASRWDYADNDTLGYNTIYIRLSDDTDPDSKAQGYVQIPYIITTPYPIADVSEIEYTQSADVLYLFHGDYNLYKITRTADDAWTVTEFPDVDGPYIARQEGDEDVRVNMAFVSGSLWQFTASSAIFGDVEVGEPFRYGTPIPGALDSVHWAWFVVSTVTSDTIIRGTLQEDTRPVYQQIVNPFFEQGTSSWQEITALASTGSLDYDFTSHRALLHADGVNDAKMEQEVLTFANVNHRLIFNVDHMSGTTPTITLKIGTASGLGDIYTSPAPITATGLVSVSFRPTQATVYVNFDSVGSAATAVIGIDQVEMFAAGDEPAGGTEYNTTDWRLAAWNSTHGYPQFGVIDGQRLICANNDANPQTIWASELANFESFGFNTPLLPGDAFDFSPPTKKRNGIRWLLDKDGLKAGTADAVWRVFAPSGGVISPTDIKIEVDEAEGSLDLKPIVAHNAILMTPVGKAPVLELVSSLEAKGFASRDIGSIADHLFKDRRIVRWAFAKDPDSVIWVILDNGQLLGLTYHRSLDRSLDVWGWHKHTCPLGEGYVDVVVIPNSSDDNTDDVYFLVNRGGWEVGPGSFPDNFMLEKLSRRITPQEAAYGLSSSGTPYDYRFLDSALTLDNPKTITGVTQADPAVVSINSHGFSNGDLVRIQNVEGMTELNNNVYKVASAGANSFALNDADDNNIDSSLFTSYKSGGAAREMVTTVSGLDHLDGQAVTAIADGVARDLTVSLAGEITLPQAASFVHVGLLYACEAETLDLEGVFQSGTTQGRKKTVGDVDIYFNQSRDLKVYSSNRTDEDRTVEFENEAYGEEPPPLYDGVKTVDISSDTGKQVRLTFKQDKPYPSHITRAIIDVNFTG